VGAYRDASFNPHYFVESGGTYTPIVNPLAHPFGTYAYGINDLGQVVGQYFADDGIYHGFVATPVPEPSSLLMSSLCVFAGLAAWLRRRRSAAAPAA
jgi:probable HAF family extracellular repeat protein